MLQKGLVLVEFLILLLVHEKFVPLSEWTDVS